MTDVDNFFDFENTDNFLNSISGGLENLSPCSISDDSIKQEFSPNNFQIDVDPSTVNPEFNLNQISNNDVFKPDFYDKAYNETLFQQSNSLSSYSNELSPVSYPASSSTHTSPVEPGKKEMTYAMNNTFNGISDSLNDELLNAVEKPSTEQVSKPAATKKAAKVVKPKKDKNSHNMIEKKYRTNINSKILALRDAVPSLRIAAGSKDVCVADLEGLTPASKLNKASVLTKATEYIKHLENKNNILKEQNIQLQRLINKANLQPIQQNMSNIATNMSASNPSSSSGESQPGFGFYPQDDYNVTYAAANFGNNVNYNTAIPVQQVPSQNSNNNNKLLLGGMTAVMGTSLFAGGNNDFKGLSALPFGSYLPYFLTHPSSTTIQMWNLLKWLLLIATIANFVFPYFKQSSDNEKTSKTNVKTESIVKTWILINLGVKLPRELSDSQTKEIVARLMGGNPSTKQLISDYLLLSSSSINFENCLLNLIIGKILIHKYPMMSFVLNNNLTIKGSLILNLEYRGENKSLIKLNKLIRNVDGLSYFGSEQLFSRLINLSENKPINFGLSSGHNHLKYIEFYQENSQDYFAILLSWRILEIIDQLNLKYLEIFNDTQQEDTVKEISNDLQAVGLLIDDKTKLYNYFRLFKSIINFNESPILLKSLQNRTDNYLQVFNTIVHGQELTDDEPLYSDEEIEYEKKVVEPKLSKDLRLKTTKTLISSLNLVSQEEFIVLTTSLIVYYYKNDEISHAIKLLKYLRNLKGQEMTLLAFTSLANMINQVIPQIEDNETLDNLIKISRVWLSEPEVTNLLDNKVTGNLTKMIVGKGMALNGIETNETDEE